MTRIATPMDRLRRRLIAADEGIASVEFAILSPVLIALLILMIDFGYVYYIKIQTVTAVNAAAQYIFQKGGAVTSSTLTTFVSNVQSVVQATAAVGTTPTVSVLYNNGAGTANMSNFYCAAGYSPVVWTSTGSSSASCGGSVQSGKFITLTVGVQARTLFPNDPIVGSSVSLAETAIVRVQ